VWQLPLLLRWPMALRLPPVCGVRVVVLRVRRRGMSMGSGVGRAAAQRRLPLHRRVAAATALPSRATQLPLWPFRRRRAVQLAAVANDGLPMMILHPQHRRASGGCGWATGHGSSERTSFAVTGASPPGSSSSGGAGTLRPLKIVSSGGGSDDGGDSGVEGGGCGCGLGGAPPGQREATVYVLGFMSPKSEQHQHPLAAHEKMIQGSSETLGGNAAASAAAAAEGPLASWAQAHGRLVRAHQWQPRAYSFEWASAGEDAYGHGGDESQLSPSPLQASARALRFLPVPAFTSTLVAARAAAVLLRLGSVRLALGPAGALALAADALVHAGRMVWQYRRAASNADGQAAIALATALAEMRAENGGRYEYVRVVRRPLCPFWRPF
jgi:hypothetical protein